MSRLTASIDKPLKAAQALPAKVHPAPPASLGRRKEAVTHRNSAPSTPGGSRYVTTRRAPAITKSESLAGSRAEVDDAPTIAAASARCSCARHNRRAAAGIPDLTAHEVTGPSQRQRTRPGDRKAENSPTNTPAPKLGCVHDRPPSHTSLPHDRESGDRAPDAWFIPADSSRDPSGLPHPCTSWAASPDGNPWGRRCRGLLRFRSGRIASPPRAMSP